MKEKNSVICKIHSLFIIGIVFIFIFPSRCYAQADELNHAAINTIVIDAGHGGHDPGCDGAHSYEKDVCLSISLKLGKLIEKNYPEIKVIYTRKTDVFVELSERAHIANQNKADLFICIHANSAGSSAYGAETYVLGLHRTEAQERVAKRENATIYLEEDGGEKYKDFSLTPDAIIARQLQLSIFLDQSINFASKVQNELKNIGRRSRGVKQAGFLVLYKTTMPSVLIETGFLTNPAEENFLTKDANQDKMAMAMFTALTNYKNELEGVKIEDATVTTPTKTPVETVNQEQREISTETKSSNSQVVFKVQILTSHEPISKTSSLFHGYPIFEYQQNGIYKYTTGEFVNDLESANKHKNKLRQSEFKHAFVVAFLDGERINLEKAINLAKN